MKKTLLSLIALVAIAVACGSKYPAEMTTLVESTISKFDSVQTIEQYQEVVANYTTASSELSTKYGQDLSEGDVKLTQELTEKLQPVMESAMQRVMAAQAAAAAADTTVAVEEVVEVK